MARGEVIVPVVDVFALLRGLRKLPLHRAQGDLELLERLVNRSLFGIQAVRMLGQFGEFLLVIEDHLLQDIRPHRRLADRFGLLQFCRDLLRDSGVIVPGEEEFEDAVLAGLILILAVVQRRECLRDLRVDDHA